MRRQSYRTLLLVTVLAATIAVGPAAASATIPGIAWVATFGVGSGEEPHDVITDADGNVYVAGMFLGNPDMDPDPVGVFTLTSAGDYDGFAVKYDSTGDFVWAVQFGGIGGDEALGIALTSSGGVVVTGYFSGTADFETGAGTSTMDSAGGKDGFLVGLDPGGALQWKYQFGGTGNDAGRGLAVGAGDMTFVAGETTGSLGDVFVAAVDDHGAEQWTHVIGGTGQESAQDLVITGGNLVVGGTFAGTVDFDPGAGDVSLSPGASDVFLLLLDQSGLFVDAVQIGGNDAQYARNLAVGGTGDIYFAGITTGLDDDFDPGAGVVELDSTGNGEVFVTRFEADLDFVWARAFGGTLDDEPSGVAVDSSGAVYVSGYFAGTADFDPDAVAEFELTPAGGQDAFVIKLSAAGAFEWVGQIGGVAHDRGKGLAVGPEDAVVLTGYFSGTADLDPGAGVTDVAALAGADAYITKLLEFCHGQQATLVGTAGSDVLDGTAGVDVIVGLGGDDTISGGDDDDIVCAGPGDDTLAGDDGDDLLDGQGGVDTVSYAAMSAPVTASLITDIGADGSFNDTFVSIENLTGSEYGDTLTGDAGPNRLFGGDGPDILEGKEGNDDVIGDAGDDQVRGGIGNDRVYGDVGEDVVEGGRGHDEVYGGDGIDEMYGGKGDDYMTGQALDDTINGKGGDDDIWGDGGDDTLLGGSGADTIDGGAGNDDIKGQRGNDNLNGGDDLDIVDGNAGTDTCVAETELNCEL